MMLWVLNSGRFKWTVLLFHVALTPVPNGIQLAAVLT